MVIGLRGMVSHADQTWDARIILQYQVSLIELVKESGRNGS